MKTPARTLITASLFSLVGFLTGCATPTLWRQTAAHDWKPVVPMRLLYQPAPDGRPAVIVVFQQIAKEGSTNAYRTAAWRVNDSATNLLATGAAARQFPKHHPTGRCMPLITPADLPTVLSPTPPGYGVWDPGVARLTIHLEGFPIGPYSLPESHTETQIATRIVVLPIAVAADAALVCVACLALGASSGCCYYH